MMKNLSCKICFEIFTSHDLKRPRAIACGHTLCGVCAIKLLVGGKLKCPLCQRSFDFQNIKDIGINHDLEDIIERLASVSAAAQPTGAISRQSTDAMSKPVEVATPKCPKLHKGICDEHGCYKVHHCQTHDVFICSDCYVSYHMEAGCRRVPIEKLLNDKTDDLRKIIKNRLSLLQETCQQVQEKCKQLESHDTMLKERELQINTQIKKLHLEKKTVNQEMKINQESTSKCKEMITECKDLQNQAQLLNTKVQTIANFQELDNETQINKSADRETQNWTKIVKDTFQLQITGGIFVSSSYISFAAMVVGQVTYATYTHDGCQWFGQIIAREGHILLQDFKSNKPQNDACVINLCDVMDNLSSPHHVYLNYSTEDGRKVLGMVVIRVNEEAPKRAKQFIDLCLGITGAGYAGATKMRVQEKGNAEENLELYDYLDENNSDTRGNLYKDLETVNQITHMKGLVINHNDDACFEILTQENHTGLCNGPSLGEVVSGLNVVKDIITKNLVTQMLGDSKLSISESGLVIYANWKKLIATINS